MFKSIAFLAIVSFSGSLTEVWHVFMVPHGRKLRPGVKALIIQELSLGQYEILSFLSDISQIRAIFGKTGFPTTEKTISINV